MATGSSVPDYYAEARKVLQEAAMQVSEPSAAQTPAERAQALATLGVGYSILAVVNQLALIGSQR